MKTTQRAVAVVGALAMMLAYIFVSGIPAAAAGTSAGPLNVALNGSYGAGPAHSGLVAGPATGTINAEPAANGFRYTATCSLPSGQPCVGAGTQIRVTWDFSTDGKAEPAILGSGGLVTTRTWSSTGIHPVKVTIDTADTVGTTTIYRTGTANIDTYVSTNYADVSANSDSAGAIWTTDAAKLTSPCRPWTTAGGTVGQGEFCASPNPTRNNPPVPSNAPARTILRNGVTGQLCTGGQGACGITADAKAYTNAGNPTGVCTYTSDPTCYTKLKASGLILPDNSGRAILDNAKCVDNVSETRRNDYSGENVGVALLRGTEPGCATYHDMLAGLVNAATEGGAVTNTAALPSVTVYNGLKTPSVTVADPTFASTTGWTVGGGASITTAPSDGSALSGGQANLPAGGSITSARAEVTEGAQTIASATGTGTGGTLSVSVTYYTAASGGTALGTYTQNGTLPDVTTTIATPSIAPYGATYASITVSSSATATIKNVTFSPKPTATTFQDPPGGTMVNTNAAGLDAPSSEYPIGTSGIIVPCASGPAPDKIVQTARALYGDTVDWCNTDRALTKRDAYNLLSTAAGWAATDGLAGQSIADLADPTLAANVTTDENNPSNPLRPNVNTALSHGVPLVGDLRCPGPASTRTCLNPDNGMSKADLAILLAGSVGAPGSATSLTLRATPSTPTTPVQRNITISVVATVPRYTNLGAVSLTGRASAGTLTCPTLPASADVNGNVPFVCNWITQTGNSGDVVTFSFTASAGGTVADTATSVTLLNHPPVLGELSWGSARNEQTGPWTATVAYSDPDGQDLAQAGTRSCDPSNDTCATSEPTFGQNLIPVANSNPTTYTAAGRTGLGINDSDPVAVGGSDQANTEVGTVTVVSKTTSGFTILVEPNTASTNRTPGGNSYVNGPYSFTLLACDSGGACTSKTYSDTVTPVQDSPTVDDVSVVANNSAPVGISLGGADPHDTGRAGVTTSVTSYTIQNLPGAGALQCANGPALCPGGSWTNITTAPFSFPSSTALRWVPPNGVPANPTFSYTGTDDGWPAPGVISANTGTVFLNNQLPLAPPVAKVSLTAANPAGSLKVIAGTNAGAQTIFQSASNQNTTLKAWVYGPAGNYRITSSQESPNQGSQIQNGTWEAVAANTWTELSATRTGVNPANEDSVAFAVQSQNGGTFYIDDVSAWSTNRPPAMNLVTDSGLDMANINVSQWAASGSSTLTTDNTVYHSGTGPALSTLTVANTEQSTVTAPLFLNSWAFNFNQTPGGTPVPAPIGEPVDGARYTNPSDVLYGGSVTVYDSNTPAGSDTANWWWRSVHNYVSNPDMNAGTAGWAGIDGSTLTTTTGRDVSVTWNSSGATKPRTNQVGNPVFATNTTHWGAARGTLTRVSAIAPEGSTYATYTPNDVTSTNYVYPTTGLSGAPNRTAATAGDVYTYQIRVRPSTTLYSRTTFGQYTCTPTCYSSAVPSNVSTKSVQIPANVWTTLTYTETVTGTATNILPILYFYNSTNTAAMPISATVDLNGAMLEKSAVAGTFFDGSSPGAAWTGAADASPSTLTGGVRTFDNPYGVTVNAATGAGDCTVETSAPSVDGNSISGPHMANIWIRLAPAMQDQNVTFTLTERDVHNTYVGKDEVTATASASGWTNFQTFRSLADERNSLTLSAKLPGSSKSAGSACFYIDDAGLWRP